MNSLKKNKIAIISITINILLIFSFATFFLITRNLNQGIDSSSVEVIEETSELNLEVVSMHDNKDDCWVIIKDRVYNVTNYIPLHPGGEEKVIETCGKDATSSFITKADTDRDHSSNAYELLEIYFVGMLGSMFDEDEPFPTEVEITPKPTLQAVINNSISNHSTASDCWIIVNSHTYDVTNYIPLHPGGQGLIIDVCGRDATAVFQTKNNNGSHSTSAWNLLENYRINPNEVNENTAPPPAVNIPDPVIIPPEEVPTGVVLDLAEVSKHNISSNCWFIINNNVYDITNYIPLHPGGQNEIIRTCGRDASTEFNTKGGKGSHSSNASNLLSSYYLGPLNGNTNDNNNNPNPGGGEEGPTFSSPQEAILDQYPGATFDEVNLEDDGESEVKFLHNGTEYKAKLDAAFNIIEIEAED